MANAMATCPTCGARMNAFALPRHISSAHKSKPVPKSVPPKKK